MAIVKKIRRKGHGVLVEFECDGRLQRVVVPPDSVNDGHVEDDVLGMGIPYGEPWSQLIGNLTAVQVENALYRAGIWTLDDLRQNPMAGVGALQNAMGAYVNQLIEAASRRSE